MKLCIGLFGTCGKSTWRQPFMEVYKEKGIEFFNPQVDDWKPELAVIEAEHLANDSIILFPVTNETYATGSLAETGFSILNAIKLESRRDFVIMIDQTLTPDLVKDNPVAAKESIRARALVQQHLLKLNFDNVYIVSTFSSMMDVSLKLWEVSKARMEIREMIQ